MVASAFLDYLTRFQVTSYVGVEDFSDKLNFLFTVIIFLVCVLIVTVKQYVLQPISCYLSTDIGGHNLHSYVENYCWVHGTIAMTFNATIPSNSKAWDALNQTKTVYYQWVPFMLGLQCIAFYIPRLIWQVICYNKTGTDIQHLVTSANQAVHSSEEARSKMVLYVARTMEQILYQHREYRSGKLAKFRRRLHRLCNLLIFSKRSGTWLILAYLFLKLTYIANGILQLFIMQHFLGFTEFTIFTFGIKVAQNIWSGTDWTTTLIFPRVTYCYVEISHLGSMNTVVAQCVLPVNMLNERIYFFLWCWILIVLAFTTCSVPVWLIRMLSMKCRRGFIYKMLIVSEEITKEKKETIMLSKFENQFLRLDGIFLLKMISINAGDIIATEILIQLWRIFKTNYITSNFLNGGSDSDDNTDRTMIKLNFQNNSSSDKNSPTAPSATGLY